MSSTELLDDLEAGELSVEFEGLEPWDVLEWAIGRFGDRLALSTAFQDGDVALLDMAYRIDPAIRVFSIDTGRLPQQTHDPSRSSGSGIRACASSFSRPTACSCSASSTGTARTCSSGRSSSGSSAATSARCSRSTAPWPASTAG